MTDDDELDERVRGLPRSIDPPADLWPAIAARIEAKRSMRRRAPIGLLLAAGLVGVLWWGALARTGEPARVAAHWSAHMPAVAPTHASPVGPAAHAELIPGEDQMRTAARELMRAYDRQRPLLDRDLLAVYDENLGIVDAAIDRSRAALAERPEDPHLQHLLDRAYHHKLALLRRASSQEERP